MSTNVDENQATWKNTMSAFKNQMTRMDRLFAEAKSCAVDLADPSHSMNGKEARKLLGPLQRKLELANNYINSLHTVLPLAVAVDDGMFSIDRLTAQLEECMDKAKSGNEDLAEFLEAIEEWEFHAVKESKPAGAGGAVGSTRTPELKGVASALKPEELTSSIAAHDMSVWVEQWNEFKDNSAFSKQGEKSIIAYLKTCVSRDILSAIDYKNWKTEKDMLDAI